METNDVVAPQKSSFECAKKINITLTAFELTGVFISIATAIFDYLSRADSSLLAITNSLSISSVIVAILLFAATQVFSSIFQKSEEVRRAGFLDNALGCRTAITASRKYYDNDDTVFGFKKLLQNLHENSLFTSEIAREMLFVRGLLLVPVLALLICVFIVGLRNVAWGVLFLSIVLSSRFTTQFLKLCDLYRGAEKIEQDCHRLYEHIYNQTLSEMSAATHEIIALQTKYDVLLSRCEIILSTKIYTKINKTLTLQWNEIKTRFSE